MRYEVPVEIFLPAGQPTYLVDNGRPSQRRQLTVLVKDERVHAKWPAVTRVDNPPWFAGRVERRSDGLVVVGAIRESLANASWSRITAVATVTVILTAIFGAVLLILKGAHYGLPPLLIGAIGAPLFALEWRVLRRARRPTFDNDAARLQAGLTRYLTTGDGTRRDS